MLTGPLPTTIVVALGGNAITQPDEAGTVYDQFRNVDLTCKQLLELLKEGYRLVITHGNGPQAGNLLLQQEEGGKKVPAQPLDVIGAMTQGQIGYMIQQSLQNHLRDAYLQIPVVSLVTQVVVNGDDEAFKNPSKPIGPFYSKEEAEKLSIERGYIIKRVETNTSKRYRRVVPSPDPVSIVERKVINRLASSDAVVIACGGGGIPVIQSDGRVRGVRAVVDKDLASERLAEELDAEILLILTNIDKVKLNYGMSGEKSLDEVSLKEVETYQRQGQFPPGTMGPKLEACRRFVAADPRRKGIIASWDAAIDAVQGKAGTLVHW